MILVAFAWIALVIAACFGLLVALEVFAPNVARGWFGALADNDYDEQAEYAAAAAREEFRREALELAQDPAEQERLSESFTELADKPFDWQHIERSIEMHRRANIAKANRQKSGQAQMRATWERPFGGGTDAA